MSATTAWRTYSLTDEQTDRISGALTVDDFEKRFRKLTDIAAEVVEEYDIHQLDKFAKRFGTREVVKTGMPVDFVTLTDHLNDFAVDRPELEILIYGGADDPFKRLDSPDCSELGYRHTNYLLVQTLYGDEIAARLHERFPDRGVADPEAEDGSDMTSSAP